jgi:hypothetical protein
MGEYREHLRRPCDHPRHRHAGALLVADEVNHRRVVLWDGKHDSVGRRRGQQVGEEERGRGAAAVLGHDQRDPARVLELLNPDMPGLDHAAGVRPGCREDIQLGSGPAGELRLGDRAFRARNPVCWTVDIEKEGDIDAGSVLADDAVLGLGVAGWLQAQQ